MINSIYAGATHTEVLQEWRVVAARAKRRNVEVRFHETLALIHELVHNVRVHSTVERATVLARIP